MSLDTKLVVAERVEEIRFVLLDAIARYTVLAPTTPEDYIAEEVRIEATFGQAWGNTAGGFGGAGGNMITGSTTWVIRCSGFREAFVYFGNRLAHATDDDLWLSDCIKRRRFPASHMPWIRPEDPTPIRRALAEAP